MKKTMIILLSAFLFACNDSGEGNKTETGTDKTEQAGEASHLPPGVSQEEVDQGLNLVATSDCLTCHKINEKLTGPSYVEIANKYEINEANVEMLAGKIIHGGSGNWGSIPMTPHDGLPEEDAKLMVKYVLSLKNAK